MSEDQKVIMQVNGEDTELSLADLAGLDMTDVVEVRSSLTPAGLYHWKIKDAKIDSVDVKDKEDTSQTIPKPVVQFELEAQNCMALVDDTLDVGDYINEKFFKTFWISTMKDLGKVKAFLVDIGVEGNKTLDVLITEAHGMEFVGKISHAKNKDNPDRPWVNMDEIMTLAAYQEATAE